MEITFDNASTITDRLELSKINSYRNDLHLYKCLKNILNEFATYMEGNTCYPHELIMDLKCFISETIQNSILRNQLRTIVLENREVIIRSLSDEMTDQYYNEVIDGLDSNI